MPVILRAIVIAGLIAAASVAVPSSAMAKYASIVIDASSGQVLYARKADTPRYPASLTKMMTLYLAFEALQAKRLGLESRIRVSARAARQPASKLGLRKGQTLQVSDAILGLAIKSANDAAVALAEHMAGSEANFARRMTLKARQLGMRRTTFRNASGLPHRKQRSTARDMAQLGRAIIRDFPQYYGYFSRTSFKFRGKRYRTHNNLLGRYEGTDGIKTGYINASGFNLVASVNRDGRRLIGVVFGGKTAGRRDRHMRRILDKSFKRLAKYVAPPVAPVPLHKPVKDDRLAGMPAGWKIQVGAFDTYAAALHNAIAAADAAARLLDRPGVVVIPVAAKNEHVFRAQLTTDTAAEAQEACQLLQRKQFECITIAPST